MIDLKELARKLGLRTMVANWEKCESEKWVEPFLLAEDTERDQRTLERRLKEAQIGQFKPMSEFDWNWPKKVDREQIEELLTLDFVAKKFNAVFVSTNGLGKTMIAQNLASMAILKGYKTRFVKASQMLNHLLESDSARKRAGRMRAYCSPDLLVIDEVGYMNYDNRYADLLYEVISGRYQKASTVVTTEQEHKTRRRKSSTKPEGASEDD